MKLSDKTLSILKNFATINSGIYFKEGTNLSTVSSRKNILADAVIDEQIPVNFAIYDLNNFLSVVSLFKEGAELDFDDKHVYIKGVNGRSGSRIKYRITSPSMIVAAPDKRPTLPSVDLSFHLSQEVFDWIIRVANVIGSPNIAIQSDGNSVKLISFDSGDDQAHSQETNLEGVSSDGKSFTLVFRTENLKMLLGAYDVEISSKGIAKFTNSVDDITYFVTLEINSVYN